MKKARTALSAFLVCIMVAYCFAFAPIVAAGDTDTWDGTFDTSWYDASASSFTLTSAEQFAGLAKLVNESKYTFENKTVELGVNVRLNDTSNFASWGKSAPARSWTPIGYYKTGVFQGNFNGNGHTISGVYVNDSAGTSFGGRPALFGYIKGADIGNFTIEYSYVNGKNATGVVAGYTEDIAPAFHDITLSHCAVAGTTDGTALLMGKTGAFDEINVSNITVIASSVDCTHSGGAIFGFISGTTINAINITGCSVDVTLNKTYNNDMGAGGLIGQLGRTSDPAPCSLGALNITDTSVKVTATGPRDVGGAVGTVILDTLGSINFDGVDVAADIDCHSGAGNIADVGSVISYLRVYGVTGKILFKDMNVSGTVKTGQNSGGLIGRICRYGSKGTFTGINEIEVKDVTMDVDLVTKKGTGNVQCIGGVIGLAQDAVTTLTVDRLTTTNTYTSISSNGGNDSFGGILGSGTVANLSVTDSILGDAFTALGNNVGGICGTLSGDSRTFTVSGCLVKDDITITGSYTGALLGKVSAKNLAINVEKAVVLGNFPYAVAGGFSSAYTKDGLVNIENLYFNGTDGAKLGAFNDGGYAIMKKCVYYTPWTDSTVGYKKQQNAAVVKFLDETKDLSFELAHTCTSVEMARGIPGDKTETFTLGCEIPGCPNHRITEGTVCRCIGASVRTGTNAGLRFGFRFSDILLEGSGESVNMGMILIPETLLGASELTLDTPRASVTKATKCFTEANPNYSSGTVTFSGVLAKIPDNKKDAVICARAYVTVGSTVYYSDTVSASYNLVAGMLN